MEGIKPVLGDRGESEEPGMVGVYFILENNSGKSKISGRTENTHSCRQDGQQRENSTYVVNVRVAAACSKALSNERITMNGSDDKAMHVCISRTAYYVHV